MVPSKWKPTDTELSTPAIEFGDMTSARSYSFADTANVRDPNTNMQPICPYILSLWKLALQRRSRPTVVLPHRKFST